MKKCMKYKIAFLLLSMSMLLLTACGKKEAVSGNIYQIYYLNKEETKVIMQQYEASNSKEDSIALIEELLVRLQTPSESIEEREAINSSVRLLDFQLTDGQLILNFDESYKTMPPTTEVLVRAALARTLTQVEEVKFVSIAVLNEPLTDMLGNVVGAMTADMFIDNAGAEINAYEKIRLHLYFANEDGTKLVPVTRDVVYNSNIPVEKLVLEELIKGPTEDEKKLYSAYPFIDSKVKLNSVTVKDGIAYMNVDDKFLTQIYNVTADVTIYAFANSLADLSNVNKLQIYVNGENELMYRERISLTNVFERNLEMIEQ